MRMRLLLTAGVVLAAAVSARATPFADAKVSAASACLPSVPSGGGSAARLIAADNGLGFRLLRRIASHNVSQNVFISPASVALALDMAYDGSRGSTRAAMASSLGLRGLSDIAIRSQAAALLNGLRSDDSQVQLRVANALWARAGVSFNPDFAQHISRSFGARAVTADFSSPSTVNAINHWVSCATDNTITSIVSRLKPSDVMVLLNALYFHGNWSSPFHNANTHPASFTTNSGAVKQLPFMNATGTYAFADGSDYQAITLPYGTGRYVMKIVLPKSGTSIGSFLSRLTASRWHSWTSATRPTEVVLRLPRFTIRNDRVLNSELASMGMAPAFRRNANFTGICPRCFLSTVIHKTFLAVDEKGTTASAVTGVVVGTTAVGSNRATMIVDHPFLVELQDTRTGSMLFAGSITDPTS